MAVLAGPPADFEKLIADETEKWGKVIRTANIKAKLVAVRAHIPSFSLSRQLDNI